MYSGGKCLVLGEETVKRKWKVTFQERRECQDSIEKVVEASLPERTLCMVLNLRQSVGFFWYSSSSFQKKKNIEMFYIIWLKLYNFFVIVFKRRFGEKGFGFQSHFDNKTFLSYRNYNHQINCIFFKYPWHKPLTSFIFFETFLALSKNIHGAIFFLKSSIL